MVTELHQSDESKKLAMSCTLTKMQIITKPSNQKGKNKEQKIQSIII